MTMRASKLVRVQVRPDTPEQVRERIRYEQAREQATREMWDKFQPITDSNADAALEWKAARVRELIRPLLS